ncbi:polysaccharide deacetylase family protein [Archangium violaceum]|uniref:polysaccharide deacetylase family protein n=1 Tax=Archangium violaceum TaxID=83451 RepID=UPI00193C0D41|nr:polysaccharide deacetylase family protein [Archangium violaceum]QRK04439.1 polysaccharide deacetylase family protein [Archangium violaceum]
MARRSPVHSFLALAALVTSACAWVPSTEPEAPLPREQQAPVVQEPTASVTAPIVTNGSRNRMRIALTFDACSTHKNEYDERVIRTLVETGTPATLFIGGGWALANPGRVQELAQYPGFEFGNHTFSHPHMPRVKDDRKVLEELQRTQRVVYDLSGRIPKYFRPPFGEVDLRVAWIASQAALTTINYDLPSGDPDRSITPKRLVDWVLRQASPGGIVVMHMNHKRFPTAQALPDVIKGLRKRGFELVTVGTLLEDDTWPTCMPSEEPERPVVANFIP